MLQGIMGIAGVLGGLGNAQAGRGMMGKGLGYIEEGHEYALDSLKRQIDEFKRAEARGEFNSAAEMEENDRSWKRFMNVSTDNAIARDRELGYRRGDSNTAQGLRHMSEKGQIEYANSRIGLKDKFQQKRMQYIQGIDQSAQNFANFNSSIGKDIYGIGQRQAQAGASGMISSLGSLAGADWNWMKIK